MKTIFAIDESGNFNAFVKGESFVCGSVIKDENLEKHFQKAYTEIYPAKNPLLGTALLKDERFHFCKLGDEAKKICREILLPLVSKVYRSFGKPALFANNQDWWLVALTVVVAEFLKKEDFERGSRVEIHIDGRKSNVWGMVDDERLSWKEYHGALKSQLEKYFKHEIAALKKNSVEVEFKFANDEEDFAVALADIACGSVRCKKGCLEIISCDCMEYQSKIDPVCVLDSNPTLALDLVLQEVCAGNKKNCELVEKILCKMNASEGLNEAFERFYDLVKGAVDRRCVRSQLSDLSPIVRAFKNRLETAKIGSELKLKIMLLILKFDSHIGSVACSFSESEFLDAMNESRSASETRLLRKWENYIDYHLRAAQIDFNAYRFESAVEKFEKLHDQHCKILECIPEVLLERNGGKRKDEHLTAILGTLAQSYAYGGKFTEAEEYFDLSNDYAIKSSSQTASYQFSIAFLKEDLKNAEKYFKSQTELLPRDYFSKGDYSNNWFLLSYCKFRALELHLNGKSNLKRIEIENLKGHGSDYPFPLIQKWAGVALQIENHNQFSPKIKEYYLNAIQNLQKESSSFVYRTLALPIIQCLSLLNPQNEFQSQYNTKILPDLIKMNSDFGKYIDDKKLFLKTIKNDEDLWVRATSLPFIYS